MKMTQLRHGSHIIHYKDRKYLVDPVFAEKGTMPALPMGRVKAMNPLRPMPISMDFIEELDGVILTHLHFDHYDNTAKQLLPKDIKVYCHLADAKKVQKDGFMNVVGLDGKTDLGDGITIETVDGGRHGKGIRRVLMGRTTGYVISDQSVKDKEPTVYIVGDSVWCEAVEQAINHHEPNVIIAFAGEARLLGKAITMSTDDLNQLATHAQQARIIVNHMDTWNHCYLTREQLNSFLKSNKLTDRFLVPYDGETLTV